MATCTCSLLGVGVYAQALCRRRGLFGRVRGPCECLWGLGFTKQGPDTQTPDGLPKLSCCPTTLWLHNAPRNACTRFPHALQLIHAKFTTDTTVSTPIAAFLSCSPTTLQLHCAPHDACSRIANTLQLVHVQLTAAVTTFSTPIAASFSCSPTTVYMSLPRCPVRTLADTPAPWRSRFQGVGFRRTQQQPHHR